MMSAQTEQIETPESFESTPKLSFIQQLRQIMILSEPKCSNDNSALYVCINSKCELSNPFICTKSQCPCSNAHQLCPQIRIKSFIKVFQRKQTIVDTLLQTINKKTDQLIDQISELRQKTIQKFKNGHDQEVLGSYVDKAWWNLKQQTMNVSTLNGELMSQIWQSDQKIDTEKKHQNVISSIDKAFAKFQLQIESEFERIFKIIIQNSPIEKFYWSRQLRGSSQLIQGRIVKKISGSTSDRFALLQPSLTKINAKKIQWSVRAIKVAGWVGLGICVRSLVEKNKFDFINYTHADHGSYIISSNGYTWGHQNPQQNSNMTFGIEITSGCEIVFDLDLESKVLKYTNKQNQKGGSLNLVYELKKQEEYHICSCLGSGGDEIEIIGNIVVDGFQVTFDDSNKNLE